MTLAAAACTALVGLYGEIWGIILPIAVNLTGIAVYAVKYSVSRAKFVFTGRGKRLLIVWAALQFTALVAIAIPGSTFKALFLSEFFAFSPLWLMLAAALTGPIERRRNAKYLKKEAAFYRNIPAIKIAVTGSFGKTTVKETLKYLLTGEYTVLATDGNKNTPFGVLECVKKYNGEQVIITEFGARRSGDIEELISLFPPDYAIITGVTAQHIESFKTLENIVAEKFKLAKAVEPKRLILNVDNAAALKESAKYPGSVTVGERGDFTVSHFRENAEGICFLMTFDDADKDITAGVKRRKRLIIKAPVHGRHNASNLAVAVAAAIKLGVSAQTIAEKLTSFKGVEHRFEVKRSGDVTIIDDGYNSNIDGVRHGVEALKRFSGRKVIAAQGISESGREKAEINTEVGKIVSDVADVVLVTGINSRYIIKGLKSVGFGGDIRRFGSFKALEKALPEILRSGDTVWFQNDVP